MYTLRDRVRTRVRERTRVKTEDGKGKIKVFHEFGFFLTFNDKSSFLHYKCCFIFNILHICRYFLYFIFFVPFFFCFVPKYQKQQYNKHKKYIQSKHQQYKCSWYILFNGKMYEAKILSLLLLFLYFPSVIWLLLLLC